MVNYRQFLSDMLSDKLNNKLNNESDFTTSRCVQLRKYSIINKTLEK